MRVLLLPLSTALAVRTIECTNHSLQRCLSQKEFYRETLVFRHLDMDFTIFLMLS